MLLDAVENSPVGDDTTGEQCVALEFNIFERFLDFLAGGKDFFDTLNTLKKVFNRKGLFNANFWRAVSSIDV